MSEEKKPINAPRGWAMKKEYIADNGDVYSFGKFVKEGTPPVVETIPPQVDKDDLAIQVALLQEQIKELMAKKEPVSQSFDSATLADAIGESMVRSKEKQKGGLDLVDQADIEEDDYIKDGKSFSAAGTGYWQIGDKRMNRYVHSPLKTIIKFQYQGTNRHKGALKEEQISHFCTYTSYSKKEVQWLREHSLYGIKFWETVSEALSADANRAQMAAQFMNNLQRMDQHQLLDLASHHNLPKVNDNQKLRASIANAQASEKMAQEYDKAMSVAKEHKERQMMTGQ